MLTRDAFQLNSIQVYLYSAFHDANRCKAALQKIKVSTLYLVIAGSEFSVVWGKRGEGGQGREGVQLPDSLVDEAVFQPVGPGLETPQSPPWW